MSKGSSNVELPLTRPFTVCRACPLITGGGTIRPPVTKQWKQMATLLALVCSGCGAPFLGYANGSAERYCSKQCHSRSRSATPEQDTRIRELYPDHSNTEIAALLGVPINLVRGVVYSAIRKRTRKCQMTGGPDTPPQSSSIKRVNEIRRRC